MLGLGLQDAEGSVSVFRLRIFEVGEEVLSDFRECVVALAMAREGHGSKA